MTKLYDDKRDSLESASRRDNLKLFNIVLPQSQNKTNRQCVDIMLGVLRDTVLGERWNSDDIVRAHRIGKTDRRGRPPPMIAKFSRWSDKMTILRVRSD